MKKNQTFVWTSVFQIFLRHLVKCLLVCNYCYYSSNLFWRLVLYQPVSDRWTFFGCFDTFIKNKVKKISKQIAFPFKIFVSMSCSCVALAEFNTGWKVSKYGVFFDPYFLAFGLNTERYEVSLHIQSKCGKIRTRKNSVFGHISHSASS